MKTLVTSDTRISPEAISALPTRDNASSEAGFSLIEAAVALVIILVALLGVAWTITYAINYNAGNNNRAKVLAVLQREVERLRSAKFTPSTTDAVLAGCDLNQACSSITVTSDELSFVVTKTIDNNPTTAEVDDESEV